MHTSDTRNSSGKLFLGEDYLLSLFSSVAYCFLCMVKVLWNFLCPVWMLLGIFLIQSMFGQSCWQDFISVSSDNTRIHSLTADFLIPWLL